MKYFILVGEASGDLHASNLLQALREQDPQAVFVGLGGDKMQAQGCHLYQHYRQMAFMGLADVLRNLGKVKHNLSLAQEALLHERPDVLILVDYPSFNLRIAKFCRRALPGTKIVYYIPPKIWAWKRWRVHTIAKVCDRVLGIFPFEPAFYQRFGYECTYVGNPTVDELAPVVAEPFDRDDFCRRHEVNANQSIIALLPGSRKAEVNDNLPLMLEAATTISCHQLIIAGAPGLTPDFYERIIRRYQMVPPVRIVFGETYNLVRAAEVAAVTSGTATLETAYLRCPQVVCYRFGGGKLVYSIMKQVLRHIRFVSLVNLVIDGFSKEHPLIDPAVPELLGYKCTSQELHQHLVSLSGESEARSRMLAQYEEMIRILGAPGAPVRAAEEILRHLH